MSEYIRSISGTIEVDTNKLTHSLEIDVDSFEKASAAIAEFFERVRTSM